MPSSQSWSCAFDLSPTATSLHTLPQTLAHGIHTLTLLYGPSSTPTIIHVLSYILQHIASGKGTLIRDIDLSAKATTGQLQKDLLLGIGNCLVEPVYCEHKAEAALENAVRCQGLFELLVLRAREGMITGREGDEGVEVREVTEEDLVVPDPREGKT